MDSKLFIGPVRPFRHDKVPQHNQRSFHLSRIGSAIVKESSILNGLPCGKNFPVMVKEGSGVPAAVKTGKAT